MSLLYDKQKGDRKMYRAETWAGYCPVGGVLVRLSRDSEER